MTKIPLAVLLMLNLLACSQPSGVDASDTDQEIAGIQTPFQQALETGDASLIQGTETLSEDVAKIAVTYRQTAETMLQQIYGADSIIYVPGRNSQFIQVKELTRAYPLIIGNGGLMLAAASEIKKQRNIAFASNIIAELASGNFTQFEPQFKNALGWLLQQSDAALNETKIVTLLAVSDSTASKSNTWLAEYFPLWQVKNCKDTSELSACLYDSNLLIVSTSKNIEKSILSAALNDLKSKNVPMLYVHQDSWNSSELTPTVLNPMGFFMQSKGGPGNYFSQDSASWDHFSNMLESKQSIAGVSDLINRLETDNFDFSMSQCSDNCNDVDNFNIQFNQAWNIARNSINQLDKDKVDVFSSEGYELEKRLILLADKYRQDTIYPMDKTTTPTVNFLRAYFADGIIYSYRGLNPAQQDLGNFSRSDFSHITPSNKTINLTSKRSFRSAGVYALPGQTFTITRTDSSEVNTKIFINTQRSGSTHEFSTNGYSRPKFLQSQHITINVGETIKLTHPYGGPIQIEFSANDIDVSFEFKNIGLHPYWNAAEDNETFTRALDSGNYDWAELVTPGFEVHSQLAKMRESMENENWNTAKDLADATMQYVHNYPHVLAGFKGPGIDAVPEIHNFASEHNYTINNIDMVKHMNADQATCGSGCSGNPYDAYWSFNPTGHGDIHELGHGLERGRFRFSGWEGHASTNPYSYYTKSQFHKNTGNDAQCQSLPFDSLYQTLLDSQASADAFNFMQNANLNSWNQGVAIYIQMMMAAQSQNALQDGWHLLARLHIFEREFNRAVKNEKIWLEKRSSLGMSSYDLSAAKALGNNDWLTLSISWVTKLDYRDFFTMWGLVFSTDINAQLDQHGFAKVNTVFYQVSGNDYCHSLDKTAVSITP